MILLKIINENAHDLFISDKIRYNQVAKNFTNKFTK